MSVVVFAWINLSQAQNNAYNVFIDQDQDGLTDQEELLYGTDPTNPDTDEDGYQDGKEINSGYDPLKPAPGDKIISDQTTQSTATATTTSSIPVQTTTENLTETFLEKIKESKASEVELLQEISQNPNELNNKETVDQLQNISLTQEELENILKETMDTSTTNDKVELIDEAEVKVMDRPKGDDEEEIKAKEKKQIEEYLVSFGYIMLKNAPFELQQSNQLQSQTLSFVNTLSSNLQSGDFSQVDVYRSKAQSAYDELKALETPYVLKDIHISALSIFKYVIKQDANSLTNEEDPLNMVLMIGKLQSAASELEQLGTKVEAIMKEYDINTLNQTAQEVENKEED